MISKPAIQTFTNQSMALIFSYCNFSEDFLDFHILLCRRISMIFHGLCLWSYYCEATSAHWTHPGPAAQADKSRRPLFNMARGWRSFKKNAYNWYNCTARRTLEMARCEPSILEGSVFECMWSIAQENIAGMFAIWSRNSLRLRLESWWMVSPSTTCCDDVSCGRPL